MHTGGFDSTDIWPLGALERAGRGEGKIGERRDRHGLAPTEGLGGTPGLTAGRDGPAISGTGDGRGCGEQSRGRRTADVEGANLRLGERPVSGIGERTGKPVHIGVLAWKILSEVARKRG